MTKVPRGLLTLTLLLMGAGCGANAVGTRTAPGGGVRSRSEFISYDEMRQRGQHSSLYTLIQDLRPRWLRSQGPDTFLGLQGQVQVHFDGNRLGGVEVLRRLSAHGVTSIQWLEPIQAGALLGLGNSHGAIIISTTVIH